MYYPCINMTNSVQNISICKGQQDQLTPLEDRSSIYQPYTNSE